MLRRKRYSSAVNSGLLKKRPDQVPESFLASHEKHVDKKIKFYGGDEERVGKEKK
jgi:hypothetical protein